MSIYKFPSQDPNDPYPLFPDELKARPQWVCWRLEKRREDDEKPTKVPYNPRTGGKAKADAPDTWSGYRNALKRLERDRSFAGTGYEFSKDDEYAGIDFDDCVNPETGEIIKDWVRDAIQRLNSYTEYSPSRTGLHVIVKARLPGDGHNDQKNGREMYDHGRFFTVTGKHAPGAPEIVEDRQSEVEALYREWWPDRPKPERVRPAAPADLTLSDSELIDKARAAENGRKFEALWSGNWEPYYGSQSEADQALCNHLAFWTARDPERMDRLFRGSLLMRDKWDERRGERGTYGQITIDRAMDSTREGYAGPRPVNASLPRWEEVPIECYAAEDQYERETVVDEAEAPPPETKAAPRASGFRLVMVGDLVAQAKAPEWLIKGVVEINTLCQTFGDSESGKSLIEIDKACCIAAGIPWHDHKVKQGAVIYLAGEGHGGLARRFRAWGRHHGIDMSALPLAVSAQAATLYDAEAALEVAQSVDAIVEATGQSPAYIVIDTLARNFGGDENATQDMNQFILNLDVYLRARYEAAVCVVHHPGHGDKDRGRGSGALKGAVDTEFKVCMKEEVIAVEQRKSKDGPKQDPMYFRKEWVDIGLADEDGNPVGSVVIVQTEGPPDKPDNANMGEAQRKILDELIRMYQEAKARLTDRGEDREPLIEVKGWRKACIDKGHVKTPHFNRTRDGLLERKLIRIDGIHVTPASEVTN